MTQLLSDTATTRGIMGELDKRAMKTCDKACFYHRGSMRGEGEVVLSKDVETNDPWEGKEKKHKIECDSRVTMYEGENQVMDFEGKLKFSCFEMISNYDFSPNVIRGLAQALKKGDQISLDWMCSGNGYSREAGLYMCCLRIVVKRGDSKVAYMMDSQVCPDNTARMIRYA